MAKRLGKEFSKMGEGECDWLKAELVDENLFHWKVSFEGPEKSPYAGGKFVVDVAFPSEYPFKAPEIKFITQIYHPNVKRDDGGICQAALLPNDWSPQLKVHEVMLTLRELLSTPNPDDPLEADIATQFKDDKKAFEKTAKEWTSKNAK